MLSFILIMMEATLTKRKRYTNEFKSKVALAAIKGEQTTNEIASEFGIIPTMLLTFINMETRTGAKSSLFCSTKKSP